MDAVKIFCHLSHLLLFTLLSEVNHLHLCLELPAPLLQHLIFRLFLLELVGLGQISRIMQSIKPHELGALQAELCGTSDVDALVL